MMLNESPPPYPREAFYVVVKDAMEEVWKNTQAPDALVAMEFLACMSAAAQGLYDVRLPTGQCRPVSLYSVVMADSGERKTGVSNCVGAPLIAHDLANMARYEADMQEYAQQKSVWESIEVGLRRKLTKLTQEGEPLEETSRALIEHTASKPIQPKLRRLIRENATSRAMMEALEGDGQSIALKSDEGDVILRGGALSQIGLANKLWDGPAMFAMDRSRGENIIVRNPRVTIAYMMQSQVFKDALERRGDIVRASGHLARYLVGYPASTQGTRYTSEVNHQWHDLPVFHERMRDLLNEYGRRADAGATRRETLEFSEDAVRQWIVFTNQTEDMLQPWGFMHDIKDFASKALEIAARIAALLHVFSKQEGPISAESLTRSVDIINWHLCEFRRIFSSVTIPQELRDVEALERYLFKEHWRHNFNFVRKNYVLRNGPIRRVSRLDAALERLVDMNAVWLSTGPKKVCLINFDNQYFRSLSNTWAY